MLRSARKLRGFAISASDGSIGAVEDLYFEDDSWVVRYAVVDTGHWLPGRKVLISPISFGQLDWEHSRLPVRLTREQVRQSPDVDTHRPVSRQQEIEFARHYGYPLYWDGAGLWGIGAYPGMLAELPPSPEPAAEAPDRTELPPSSEDSHLRSVREVTGYHILARDGEIGHVEDFLIDDRTWEVKHLVVDTSNWWTGKGVLISPRSIANVDWLNTQVVVDLTREAIKSGPRAEKNVT